MQVDWLFFSNFASLKVTVKCNLCAAIIREICRLP